MTRFPGWVAGRGLQFFSCRLPWMKCQCYSRSKCRQVFSTFFTVAVLRCHCKERKEKLSFAVAAARRPCLLGVAAIAVMSNFFAIAAERERKRNSCNSPSPSPHSSPCHRSHSSQV
ncbi:hypothetical protein LWI29_031167 [Acer saccharum]|uniref:Uncharacterized protein n=1 Tax=Acer saccharum TaxID=4024 RepID=A0AA39W7E3_ACESA|nr:hypothetical protein LWI29_031167 [Acer saccharum]